MTARPIRYQRQVSDRNGKIFYTSITSLSHISKRKGFVTKFKRKEISRFLYSPKRIVIQSQMIFHAKFIFLRIVKKIKTTACIISFH